MPQLDAGNYWGRLVNIEDDQSSGGSPYIRLCVDVTHVADGDQWVPLDTTERRTIRWFTTPKAEPYTVDKLVALGFNGDLDRPQFAEPDPRNGMLLVCRLEDYQGKTYERWDTPAAGEQEAKPWAADEKRLFKAKIQTRRLSEAKPTASAPARPPTRPQAETPAPLPAEASAQAGEPDASPIRDEEVPTAVLGDSGEAVQEAMDVSDEEIPF